MSLVLNLATRGRAELLTRTILTTSKNITRPDTVFMIAADADDAETLDALGKLQEWGGIKNLYVSIEAREDTIAAKWNRALKAFPNAAVYMPMCDDGPAITAGFDEKVLEAAEIFPDGIGVVFNHLENLSFTGIQAVTARMAAIMGHIYVEHFPYWFVDHWLSDLARMTDRFTFADARLDCGSDRPHTMEMREPAFWATLYDACKNERHEMAECLFDHMSAEPQWRKAMLRTRFLLVDQYSDMINNSVRAMGMGGPPPDERYARLKAQAVAKLTDLLPSLREQESRAA